jgi:hypothetical protein
MNYLPIADRELRVAVRKRSTFWLRVAAALTGLVIGGGCLLLSKVFGANSVRMGSILFNSLTWLCLVAGLSAGLFFTSDCLSEEKREGTLGLLFLTDLRGYDVALAAGHLPARLLCTAGRAPILAITLPMGGVTGAQYWKATLALVNALFVSLAAGLAVSVVSRDSQKALTATFFVLLVFALGGPLTDGIIAGARHRTFQPRCSLSSPAYVLGRSRSGGGGAEHGGEFAGTLLVWHVDGPHLQERKPGHAKDNPLCSSHPLVCDRLYDHLSGWADAVRACFPRQPHSTGFVLRLVATVECFAGRRLGGGQGHRVYPLVTQETVFLPP